MPPERESDSEISTDAETTTEDEQTTIRAGRNFEQTYRLPAAEAGDFLIAVGEQLREDNELTLSDDSWELPFGFGEPIEVEVDFDGVDDPELELEIEIPGRPDDTAPRVE
jgi:amphi-Trp domain-containing protein